MTKINAMESYVLESKAYPHPHAPKALQALASNRGAQSGYLLAEAFQVVRIKTT